MKNPDRKAMKRRAQEAAKNGSDTLLIYNSNNGSTLQYAKWIVNATDCDVMPYSRSKLGYVVAYQNIIFCGWIRAMEITRLRLLRQNASNFNIEGKNFIICGVGIMDPTEEYRKKLIDYNSLDVFDDSNIFLLPGRYDPKKANVKGKGVMKAMGNTMFDLMNDEETELLKYRFEHGYDGMDINAITPIVEKILASRK